MLAAVFTFAERRELIGRNPATVADRCRLNADEVQLGADADEGDSVNPVEVLWPEQARHLIAAGGEASTERSSWPRC